MAGGRPTNASKETDNYLREECQMIESYLNELEEICKKPNLEQKEDMIGTIGLLIGKISIRFVNIEKKLELFDE
jgi:hypothetical protein